MTTLSYPDSYLARHCTDDREARALANVDDLGEFADGWRERLAVLQCYIIACQECQADREDLFTTKLKTYRGEFDRQLAMARAATPDAAGTSLVFAIPLERG